MSEWTDTRVAQLKDLWAEGLSSSQIAFVLGVTRNTVVGKLHRLKMRSCGQSNGVQFISRAAFQPQSEDNKKPKRAPPRQPSALTLMLRRAAFQPRRPNENPLNVGLLDLAERQCRYSSSKSAPFLFCGQPAIDGHSWCADCARVVFAQRVAA